MKKVASKSPSSESKPKPPPSPPPRKLSDTVPKTPLSNLEDKVWVSVTYTVSLRKYENIKIDGGISVTVGNCDPEKLLDDIMDRMIKKVVAKGENVRESLEDYSDDEPAY